MAEISDTCILTVAEIEQLNRKYSIMKLVVNLVSQLYKTYGVFAQKDFAKLKHALSTVDSTMKIIEKREPKSRKFIEHLADSVEKEIDICIKFNSKLAVHYRNKIRDDDVESGSILWQLSKKIKEMHEIENTFVVGNTRVRYVDQIVKTVPTDNVPDTKVAEISTICIICCTETKNIVFLTCGHVCFCEACSIKYTKQFCPICRNMSERMKIYY